MLNLVMNEEGNFTQRLRKLLITNPPASDATPISSPELRQWLEYWNDADSVAGNLRKLEHWLQRAQPQQR
ncbi:MAG: hypothetical protein AB7T07_14675 [Steroidobacteraceae bacterium]